MDNDVTVCKGRNIHKRTEKDILDLVKAWEETPPHYLRLDVRSLLQSDAITEVEMEVVSDTELEKGVGKDDNGEGEGEKEGVQDGDETKNGEEGEKDKKEDEDEVSRSMGKQVHQYIFQMIACHFDEIPICLNLSQSITNL